ncbi:MAG: TonB-dependent receptor [Crocinitomicaceae bacterium]|nr:TonB-dependent receptor [Crocinitomicaceae bacterium]MCF8411624.1 TonB-dependent receptor [Crocinitomicaceae bacterium]
MRFLLVVLLFLPVVAFNQTGVVKGKVVQAVNGLPIELAKVQIIDQQKGTLTNENGDFELTGLAPGVYSFKAVASGFKDLVINEISVTNSRTATIEFQMEDFIQDKEEIVIVAKQFTTKSESPNSLKTLNSTEIERLPGAGRDVSKVIAALPGVASRATFRNDIIIRGGSPGENKFYLDGIEVPNINHFATQGSSGGPVGLLNVNFIREVDFYSGAFPSNRANGLSSVLSFKQKDGNPDALITNFALGSSDAALTLDGPIGKKVDFILSARRSYLQFLFAALQLPILPAYNDFQYKVNVKVNKRNKVTFIGLGAIDVFKLNQKVNESVTDTSRLEYNNYVLNNLPIQNQWNYTVGMNWQHSSKNSFQNIVLSRNMLNNSAYRYKNLIETPENLLLDYKSFEAENKFRFEHTYTKNGWRFNTGLAYEYARYFNSTYNNITIQGQPVEIDYSSNVYMSKFALFSQLSKALLNEKMNVSLGLRTDFSNYAKSMSNPLDQLSPSLSVSYRLTEQWAINGNIARYHQLPSYTILGYRNAAGELANKLNNVKYVRAEHFVLGTEYLTKTNSRFTLEGFYKNYSRYPFSVKDSLSLANVGSDFGVVGNEEIKSISTGRTFGAEFLYQQKLYKGFYAVLAYTFVRSEFKDKDGKFVPTSWDSRHIVSLTGGKRFKNGWEIGFRWLFSGGSPYTPVDVANSSLIQNWNINGFAFPDYNLLNTAREGNFHQLNMRVDKKFYLKKFSLNFYLDIQNVYGYKTKVAPIYLAQTDASGNFVVDPNDPTRYLLKKIDNTSGIVQPTLGIIIEFTAKRKK